MPDDRSNLSARESASHIERRNVRLGMAQSRINQRHGVRRLNPRDCRPSPRDGVNLVRTMPVSVGTRAFVS